MVAPIAAAAASALVPILVDAGTDMLADIVRKKSPTAGVVVDKLGAALGTGPDADAIKQMHEEDPVKVHRAAAAVEETDYELWAAVVAEVNQTMRGEAESGNRLQSSWRPIYAFELTLEFFLAATAIIYLMYAGKVEMLKALAELAPIAITYVSFRLGVLGVYVDARRREKLRGVAR